MNTLYPIPFTEEAKLKTLVENRKVFTMDAFELNVFETHKEVQKVPLQFDDMVLTSMIKGKKVMHLDNLPAFNYFPGESVILPPNEKMEIDFPEANASNPTQCIALAISNEHIKQTIELLNYKYPKELSKTNWSLDFTQLHLTNSGDLTDNINRIIKISLNERCMEKDVLLQITVKELLIRLMQTSAKSILELHYKGLSTSNALSAVVAYIKENIRENIALKKLTELACMSRATFFRHFKQETGLTPSEFILEERLKLAKQYLKDNQNSVTTACFMAGFNNLNYFSKVFRQAVGVTPSHFQKQQ